MHERLLPLDRQQRNTRNALSQVGKHHHHGVIQLGQLSFNQRLGRFKFMARALHGRAVITSIST
ncbi:MAG: hypothetical protein ACK559_18755, partial [bacterium]